VSLTDTLEERMDEIERRLRRALEQVNRRIAEIVPDTRDQQAAVAAALDARAQIVQLLGAYDQAIDALVEEYVRAVELARREWDLGVELSSTDAAILDGMIQDTADELRAAGLQRAQEISQVIYMGAVAGTPQGEIIDQVRQLLLGGTDQRGRPLAHYAATIAQTRYMSVFAMATRRLADRAGIRRYRYDGTLVRDSRPWCRQHLGQILTMEQIQEWRHKNWAGKAPGDPFVVRGGWNCRHYWTPIPD